MNLNLGCGKKLAPNYINVDVMPGEGVDQVVDLSIYPWPWSDSSIDAIHASHLIEHFFDQKKFIEECLRILKPKGILILTVPHSSCITSIGCLGHYRTYSYDTFHDYLSKEWYMFKTPRFNTVYQELRWWYEGASPNVPKWMMLFIRPLNKFINFFIKMNPYVFENLWWPLVGGAREVCWIGEKL